MPNRRLTLKLLALAAATTAAAALPAHAAGNLVDVQIVDRSQGQTLTSWWHRGMSYVAGRPGNRYAVRLVNRSANRVLVVLSVDGVNAISGETASTGQTGYVLAPYASADITGWRKSYTEAAAFYFTALPDSYAARTDRPDNVGVIGAAVFRERLPEPRSHWRPEAPSMAEGRANRDQDRERDRGGASADAAAPVESEAARRDAPSASLGAAEPYQRLERQDKKLGTGHGEREYSPTGRTTFERASDAPAEVVQIRYDSYANLVASGVVPQRRAYTVPPEPFPGFARDPR